MKGFWLELARQYGIIRLVDWLAASQRNRIIFALIYLVWVGIIVGVEIMLS